MRNGIMITKSGSQYWYLNDQLHRTDGPALITKTDTKYWFQHGKNHRTDGAAIIYPNGHKVWYINGYNVANSELEFQNYLIQQNLKTLV